MYKSTFGIEALGCVILLQSHYSEDEKEHYLHCLTCPEEIILLTKKYTYTAVKGSVASIDSTSKIAWFTPQHLGDSVFVLDSKVDKHNLRLYISTDSTEMYCRDVAD
jgi:hypothetical protein